MELKQLQYFLKVAQSGNMSKSAQELYVSQQALSKAILNLEKELGVPLFQRSVSGMKLTEYGKCLKPYANKALLDLAAGTMAVQQLRDARQYSIHFGFTVGCFHAFSAVPPAALSRWEAENPNVSVFVQEETPDMLLKGLRAEDLDLVYYLSTQPPDLPPDCAGRVLMEEPLAVLAAMPLPARPAFADLRETPVLLGRIGEVPDRELQHLYEAAGYAPRLLFYNGPFSQCAERARNREGIVICGEAYARSVSGNGLRVYPFPDGDKKMIHMLVWKKDCDHSDAVRRFMSRFK